MSNNTNPVIGAVIIARHGDRQGFYQSPVSYTASNTVITPLGEVQEYQLGDLMRRTYADASSPTYITGLNTTALNPLQLNSSVDGAGEGGVIFDSALAFWQGFYPPSINISTITLANGSIVTSPLGGYQAIQINAVDTVSDNDLEGFTGCNTWTTHTNDFYASGPFVAKANEYASFLTILSTSGLVGGRNVSLSNMWNIFDFMNVQNIHNATFAARLNSTGASTLPTVRYLANYHEYGAFTDTNGTGIGNVAGKTFLAEIIPSLQQFANGTDVKIAHYQIAYKPYLSLFNMTNVAGSGLFPDPEGIVDYASVMTLELRENMAGNGHDVRFGFKNGTADGEANGLSYYPLFGSSSFDTDLDTFVSNLQPYVLQDTESWCTACNVTTGTCALYIAAAAGANLTTTSVGSHHDKVSPIGAGFIGFAVTTAVFAAAIAVLVSLGVVSFGAATRSRRSKGHSVPLREGSMSSQPSHGEMPFK